MAAMWTVKDANGELLAHFMGASPLEVCAVRRFPSPRFHLLSRAVRAGAEANLATRRLVDCPLKGRAQLAAPKLCDRDASYKAMNSQPIAPWHAVRKGRRPMWTSVRDGLGEIVWLATLVAALSIPSVALAVMLVRP
jgi:hypothetical protein